MIRIPILLIALLAPLTGCAADRPATTPDLSGQAKRVLRVGPGQPLAKPSTAAEKARDGDVIEIAAGVYGEDVAVWRQNNLTIRGVGGLAHMRADGANAEGKGTWVIKGNNTTIENIEFSGSKVSDGNGAGIRLEGAGLTLRHCYFHDNQNGILSGGRAGSEVLIEHSEFARNGNGDGGTHNIYIGNEASFTLRYSYIHHAVVGHDVKSRAQQNYILYNRIMDEATGRSSYGIDLPNGGLSYVVGNLIQQGPDTENFTIISYGAEGLKHPTNELYVVNNTLVNDREQGGQFVAVKPEAGTVKLINNLVIGRGEVLVGPGEQIKNLSGKKTDLADPASFDYRLKPGVRAIDAGVDPGEAHGFSLRPEEEYVHRADKRPRPSAGALDAGAYEYQKSSGAAQKAK